MNNVTLESALQALERQNLLLGLFLLGTGLAFSLMGVRIFKLVVTISFGVVGFVLGASLVTDSVLQIVVGFAVALGLALGSTYAIRVSVAVLGGTLSAFVALVLLDRLGAGDTVTLAACAFAFIVAVSLSIIMYHEIIAYLTSLEGTVLFLGGLVIFLSHSPSMWGHVRVLLTDHVIFAPFLVLAGTIAGFYFQLAELRQKRTGTTG